MFETLPTSGPILGDGQMPKKAAPPDVFQIAEHVCKAAGNQLNRPGYEAILAAVINRSALDRVAAAIRENTAAIRERAK
jgi:hypothetical protein